MAYPFSFYFSFLHAVPVLQRVWEWVVGGHLGLLGHFVVVFFATSGKEAMPAAILDFLLFSMAGTGGLCSPALYFFSVVTSTAE